MRTLLLTLALGVTMQLDESTLVRLSERVVVGTVTDVHVAPWGPAEVPVTVVTLAVDETWKGPELPTLTLVQPGGALGHRVVQVEGTLPWKVGQHALVFAERSSTGVLVPAGNDVGALAIDGPLHALGGDATTGAPFRGWDLAAARAWVTSP